MTEPISRDVVKAFYEAYSARDIKRAAGFFADDIEWTISGPIDVLVFCGTHRGKAAVMDAMQSLTPQVIDITKFVISVILVDGDRAATLNRLSGRHKDDGRAISYRVAHFLRFRDDKIVEALSLIDSFDAAEQVLGHPLTAQEQEPTEGNLVAV